ncbi:MAG: cadherin domain-containing protein, partial [Methylococcales bacterium]
MMARRGKGGKTPGGMWLDIGRGLRVLGISFIVLILLATPRDGAAPPPPPKDTRVIAGSGAAGLSQVRVFDGDTAAPLPAPPGSFTAFTQNPGGEVRVAGCDLNSDGTDDIIVSPGAGKRPELRVFDGFTGQPFPPPRGSFPAFNQSFLGGVHVACGDVTGDTIPDIIAARGGLAQPEVRVFDGLTAAPLPPPLGSFLAFNQNFSGGVRVAACDLNQDGRTDIIAGRGPLGQPEVRTFDGATGNLFPPPLGSFLAFSQNSLGGVLGGILGGLYVACGDLSGDTFPDIIAAGGGGSQPELRVFDGLTAAPLPPPFGSFLAFNQNFRGGVRVAACDLNQDGRTDIIAGRGPGAQPEVRIFDGTTGAPFPPPPGSFLAFNANFTGGVYVACSPTGANEAPVVDAATFSLPENSANGTVVGAVTAADADLPPQILTYAITAGNTGNAFAIDPSSGQITVASMAALDFETTPAFHLTVRATDNGVPARSGSATITINLTNVNDAPVVSVATFSVAENSANGTPVGAVTAIDADLPAQTLTYAITAGNTGNAFAIDPSSGQITVDTMAALDFETTPAFHLTVRATDNGSPNLNGNATIAINLTDVNDAPVVSAATFSVAENSANGTPVGAVTAIDADLPAQTLTYAITAGNTGNAFAIDPSSGQIAVDSMAALNFETTPSFSLTVRATDNGSPNLNGNATIAINLTDVNETPVVSAAIFSVPENSVNGTPVGAVTAADADLPPQILTYAITAGNTGNAFAIDPSSGQITVASMAALDFETTPTFNLTVQATDNGSPNLNGSATIAINLTNVNEAPNAVDDAAAVNEGGTVTVLTTPLAATTVVLNDSDPDAGTMLFVTATPSLAPAHGLLTLNVDGTFSYTHDGTETTTDSFIYEVCDNAPTPLCDTATVSITITPVNDAPVIALPGPTVNYAGTPVVLDSSATVSDIDSPDFNTGVLSADITSSCENNDRLGVRDQGAGVGNISLSGATVQYDFGAGPIAIGTL